MVYMKKFSALLINSKMKIKTAVRHRITLVRMAIIKKARNNKCCEDVGTGEN